MLEEKNKLIVEDENNIMGVKFVSGEDIMAKVEDRGEYIELTQPHALTAAPEGAAFMPWPVMISDDNVFVSKDKVLLTYPLRIDFYAQYAQLLEIDVEIPSEEETGIFMPSEKKIIT